jgi:hypothetical protein
MTTRTCDGNKVPLRRLVLCTMIAALVSAGGARADDPVPEPPAIQQPTRIPGDWALAPVALPPIEQVVAREASARPVYGLYTWGGEYRELRRQIRDVGWSSIRLGGPIDDGIMRLLVEDDVEVMKTLTLDVEGQRKRRPDFDSDAAFIDAYTSFIARTLRRYGPGGRFFAEHPDLPTRPIRHVEIWNEPNFQYMIPPRPDVDRKQIEAEREALYAKVLPAAYRAVKTHWPTVAVVGFAAGGASAGDLRFLQAVHEAPDVPDSYDILSTHPYTNPVAPELFSVHRWGQWSIPDSYAKIRGIMDRHGAGYRPVWYTEIGWVISHEDGGRYQVDRATVPDELQAAYVVRLYALAMRLGVERVHIMFVRDTDQFNGGFFNMDGTWRPSAHAARTMIRLMPRPKLAAAIAEADDGVYAYRFDADVDKPGEQPVIMVWRVEGPGTIELPWPGGQARVTDMVGRQRRATPVDGRLSLDIGPCPVYVTP